MSDLINQLKEFVEYGNLLKGDEKGEAQVFCDRLFQAFGHSGYKEAGATLEFRIKRNKKSTKFADLIWKPRLLLEMKKRGEKLNLHYQQAFDYWVHSVPDRPRYVVLCNFDEFWIYDFNKQIEVPVDTVTLHELPKRYTALNFLLPENPTPIFGNDREAVSRSAADKVAQLFNLLISRKIERNEAQRFILQLVVSMFAEDIELLPSGIIYQIVNDCLHKNQNSYDLFGGLFTQMNSQRPASGGRFKDVRYFNGGLFSNINPIDLTFDELSLIGDEEGACTKDWSRVNPAIFGTLFQQSMDEKARHAHGVHFTSEADILRIVNPTIVYPWREKIEKASSLKELITLRNELFNFKILDPACGSGNFLYVSYREMVRLEILLLKKMKREFSAKEFAKRIKSVSIISPKHFLGIDRDEFGVELAKVTLMLAKKLALDETLETLKSDQIELEFGHDQALPLDNLDGNFINGDSLFVDWPETDVIIGNPPYQSKNKIQQELGRAYVNRVREKFSDIDGRADYCVYWFRKAHDHLTNGQRAGLVGTNTIRQNYSRYGSLDYITGNNGTISEAVSSMKWSGDAVVYVSIVNWLKGKQKGKKKLFFQEGEDPSQGWNFKELDHINSSLSFAFDVSKAEIIKENAKKGGCFQGQTHGHEGFLLSIEEATKVIIDNAKYEEVLFPYLIANELVGQKIAKPKRYVIDFHPRDLLTCQEYTYLFERVKDQVLRDRENAALNEEERNKKALLENPKARINKHHSNFLKTWWFLSYPREDMMKSIQKLERYIVCGRVTKRPIFEFVSKDIRPNDALMVFPFADDYSFGVLQSSLHWHWFINKCSTLKGDPRYTSNTVFDTFPWPQSPSIGAIRAIAKAAENLRHIRCELLKKHSLSYRELYRSLELPGKHPLKEFQAKLDDAVNEAYQIPNKINILSFLLDLNMKLVSLESSGEPVLGPGLPHFIKNTSEFISSDCISM